MRKRAYTYIGPTENGLVVVLTAYSGVASGDFITRDIRDSTRAFHFDGKAYEKLNLTDLRRVPLGDRWDG